MAKDITNSNDKDYKMMNPKCKIFNGRDLLKKLFIYSFLIVGIGVVSLPFFWMISASLKPNNDVFEFPIRWIPKVVQWQNYVDIWSRINFLTYYKNTLWLALVVTFTSLLTSSLSAYAFAKIEFPERKILFIIYVLTMAIPIQVTIVPLFIIIKNMGLSDSLWSLVLINSFSAFGVFMLRQFYMSIPVELSESARIDGLNEIGIWARIILPLSKPALSALGIFQFVYVWNDFLAPLIFLTSDQNKVIQLGLRKFITQYGVEYGLVMAGAVCSLVPVIIMYILFQKNFIQGIATTGLKG